SKPPGTIPRDFTNQTLSQSVKGKNCSGSNNYTAPAFQVNNMFNPSSGRFQFNSNSSPNKLPQNSDAPSTLQILCNNQSEFNNRLTQLETRMNQFISQMATMVETITGLQLMVIQSHMETQLKLDQITTH